MAEWESDSGSSLIRLRCKIVGVASNLPTVYFIRNGVRILLTSSSPPSEIAESGVYTADSDSLMTRSTLVVERRRGNEGIFQCVGQGGRDRSTSVTSSTYISIKCKQLNL